jgi:hypothetical protein
MEQTVFRNVGIQNSDAGELPRRKNTTFTTRRKFEIKDRHLFYISVILKGGEVTGEWRQFQIEELHDLYSSPTMIQMITSIKIRWAGYVARMGKREIHLGF